MLDIHLHCELDLLLIIPRAQSRQLKLRQVFCFYEWATLTDVDRYGSITRRNARDSTFLRPHRIQPTWLDTPDSFPRPDHACLRIHFSIRGV